jgi:putative zinc finger/helix-turn-helix YgiT family protein
MTTQYKLCLSCMEEHDVERVNVKESGTFKGERLDFIAVYEYCPNTDEYSETEDMIKSNSLNLKDAYRKKMGLLTSYEIRAIREKYDISQKDFSEILDWGMATITRYENHQIQDRAHDDILRKIDSDPKWFLEMLNRAEGRLSKKAFSNYQNKANELYKKQKNKYLVDSIYALYAGYNIESTGGVQLDLTKVIEVINYLAAGVKILHKVKLMKMLWYSDALSYKRHRKSITGLAYSALPMGAVPEGYEQIILLDGVDYDIVWYKDNVGYRFKPVQDFEIKKLTAADINTIDRIIAELGDLSSSDIVKKMHEEEAYKNTNSNCLIDYKYADKISIS